MLYFIYGNTIKIYILRLNLTFSHHKHSLYAVCTIEKSLRPFKKKYSRSPENIVWHLMDWKN